MERWSSRPEEPHPGRSARSVREPLDSHGSRCSAVSMAQLPMCEERRICAAKPIKPVACSFSSVDPASNARVVHLGQIWQGFVAAMMKRPAPDRSANERQRLRAGGGLEAVRRRHRQRRPPHTAFKETADEPGSFLTLYQTAHSESIVDRWHNFALRPCWSAARAASPSASVFSAFRSTTQRPAHLKLKGPA